MNRTKLIAYLVGASMLLGAGTALSEDKKDDDGKMTYTEGQDMCETAGGEFEYDGGGWGCDLGDGYGFGYDRISDTFFTWEPNSAPQDPPPSGGKPATNGFTYDDSPQVLKGTEAPASDPKQEAQTRFTLDEQKATAADHEPGHGEDEGTPEDDVTAPSEPGGKPGPTWTKHRYTKTGGEQRATTG